MIRASRCRVASVSGWSSPRTRRRSASTLRYIASASAYRPAFAASRARFWRLARQSGWSAPSSTTLHVQDLAAQLAPLRRSGPAGRSSGPGCTEPPGSPCGRGRAAGRRRRAARRYSSSASTVAALHAQRGGQVVPGRQGGEVVLALDPDPVREQLAEDRLGVAATTAADQRPRQVAAGGHHGRMVGGQEGRGRHAGLGELPGRGQPPGAEQRLGADRADRRAAGPASRGPGRRRAGRWRRSCAPAAAARSASPPAGPGRARRWPPRTAPRRSPARPSARRRRWPRAGCGSRRRRPGAR